MIRLRNEAAPNFAAHRGVVSAPPSISCQILVLLFYREHRTVSYDVNRQDIFPLRLHPRQQKYSIIAHLVREREREKERE